MLISSLQIQDFQCHKPLYAANFFFWLINCLPRRFSNSICYLDNSRSRQTYHRNPDEVEPCSAGSSMLQPMTLSPPRVLSDEQALLHIQALRSPVNSRHSDDLSILGNQTRHLCSSILTVGGSGASYIPSSSDWTIPNVREVTPSFIPLHE
ncbi:hypothetical protein BJ165DRAFT_562188 [Panaeolus papilionaceus]|nr:hypothetical protein BJ165DRAFT_562188 [Panaeolus papilionaceus]